jgi:hypothetical protein
MEFALASISARPWDIIKREEGIDALLHLALIVVTSRGPSQMEKNAGTGPTFGVTIDQPEGAEYMNVNIPSGLIVQDMLDRTLAAQGPERYFLYDAFDANCQDFVWSFLTSNALATPAIKQFVTQPLTGLIAKAFPPHVQSALSVYSDTRTLFGSGMEGGSSLEERGDAAYVREHFFMSEGLKNALNRTVHDYSTKPNSSTDAGKIFSYDIHELANNPSTYESFSHERIRVKSDPMNQEPASQFVEAYMRSKAPNLFPPPQIIEDEEGFQTVDKAGKAERQTFKQPVLNMKAPGMRGGPKRG